MDLFSNSSLGGALHLLGQQFSPIANTKYDLAAADQASRQANRQEPEATVQSFQSTDTRKVQFNPEERARLSNHPEVGHRSGKRNLMSSSWASFSQWQHYHKLNSAMLCKANQYMCVVREE